MTHERSCLKCVKTITCFCIREGYDKNPQSIYYEGRLRSRLYYYHPLVLLGKVLTFDILTYDPQTSDVHKMLCISFKLTTDKYNPCSNVKNTNNNSNSESKQVNSKAADKSERWTEDGQASLTTFLDRVNLAELNELQVLRGELSYVSL